ncbi:MAG: sulfatase-like hydrolase/transferase, partial [Brachybacterium sp.]|nr:sulfatase-like hydrolase/transferase [Brachybacterium sp.]
MSPANAGPSSQPGQRPNLVLVCVDQMRFDAMGCAGNEHIDTPYLDSLARGGNRFTRAYSSTPTCIPARVGLFTGTGPETHGRYGYRERISFPDAYPTTLPGTLREHGYQTYGVGKMHVWPERA